MPPISTAPSASVVHEQVVAWVVALVWLAALCLLAGLSQADELELPTESEVLDDETIEPRQQENEDSPGMIERGLKSMESQRDWVSRNYVGMWRGLDKYFASGEMKQDENDSELRLELKNTSRAEGEQESDVRVRVRVDLPNTEKKLKLFFSSDEDSTVEERVRSVSTGERIERDESVSGIEFLPDDEFRKWKRKISAGVRLRSSLVPYIKFRVKREWGKEDEEGWYREFEQEIEYFDEEGDGWSETTEFTASLPLNDELTYHIWTEAEFEDADNRFDYAHVHTLSQFLTDRSAIHYRIGALGASQPSPQLTGVFYGFSWQYQLYEDWIFTGISPEMFYARGTDWDAEPSVTFRLEIFFTE